MNIIKGNIASPLGFAADGLHAGFKKKKLDFGWIVSEVPANAGVFTTNKVIAAPLKLTKQHRKSGKMQAIVVNSGIANFVLVNKGKKMPLKCNNWPQINCKFNKNM